MDKKNKEMENVRGELKLLIKELSGYFRIEKYNM